MPTIEITDDQADRLDALQERIESELVGPYGTVRPADALEYLLDRYAESDPPLDPAGDALGAGTNPVPGDEGDVAEDEADADETDDDRNDDEGSDVADDGAAMLDSVMQLMDEHADKWSQDDSGETKYVVELPDGSTETARTQDDVRALLFKHYR